MSSPFAQLYFSEEKEYGPRSLAWRMYHVERILDIMVQIALTQGPDSGEDQDSASWVDSASDFEAHFRQDAIEDLSVLIETGIMET